MPPALEHNCEDIWRLYRPSEDVYRPGSCDETSSAVSYLQNNRLSQCIILRLNDHVLSNFTPTKASAAHAVSTWQATRSPALLRGLEGVQAYRALQDLLHTINYLLGEGKMGASRR